MHKKYQYETICLTEIRHLQMEYSSSKVFFFQNVLISLWFITTHDGFTCCLIGFNTSLGSLSLTGYENSASWPQRDKENNFLNCSERSEFL